MLALLFLVSIWFDRSQPSEAPEQTYALLLVYVLFSLVLAGLTWRNWWLDARTAIPMHFIDMAVFTIIVFSTNGYTSPFFLFFVLPLFSAAIRWGWRETAITAAALILFYLTAGLLFAWGHGFEFQRFAARGGHLMILSAALIWFGMHQQAARLFFGIGDLDGRLARDDDPMRQALDLAMEAAAASSGALILRPGSGGPFQGICLNHGQSRPVSIAAPLMKRPAAVLLFGMRKDRSLTRGANGEYRFWPLAEVVALDALRAIAGRDGFIAEVRTGTHEGWLVLSDLAELSVDFLELGAELGRAAGAVLGRDALLSAIEEGAAARTRLSLARDVHDSVVQFLAGAAFRVEAIIRGSGSSEQVELDLKELKRLLIEEQSEIRTFISALRRDRELELSEAVEELRSLARRLCQQWSIDCRVDSSSNDASIPIRLQLELQQLLREAVANAVRHGGASSIDVEVGVEQDQLRLEVRDNGSGFAPANGRSKVEPWSLKERVDRVHGSLSLASRPGCTNLVITVPLTGVAV